MAIQPQNTTKTTEKQVNLSQQEAILTKQIIPSMVLAPSAHNTQPWKFQVSGNHIDVMVDWGRHLHISDPTHRQLYVSIGCVIENALVAGYFWDYAPSVEYFPEGRHTTSPVARIIFTKNKVGEKGIAANLFSAIEARRTNRLDYNTEPLTATEKNALYTRNNEEVVLVEDRDGIEAIAKASEIATLKTLSRTDFKNELSHWVRSSWTKENDGMPGYAMGIPAPLSLISHFMVRFAPIHKQEGPKTYKQMKQTSAIAVIATKGDGPEDWMRAGQLLERVWLEATIEGIAAAPVVAAIEAGEETRAQITEVVGEGLYPQSIIRLGHAKDVNLRATPRRNIEDCLS